VPKIYSSPIAITVPFDNDTNGFTADEVQGAIEELGGLIQTSTSPGFGFGKGGSIATNTYLLCEGVPSNISGRYVYVASATITKVFVSVQIASTFDLEVFHHDGNEVNMTSLGTVSVVASTGGEFVVSWAIPTQKQIAMRVINGTAKNAVAGLQLEGTT